MTNNNKERLYRGGAMTSSVMFIVLAILTPWLSVIQSLVGFTIILGSTIFFISKGGEYEMKSEMEEMPKPDQNEEYNWNGNPHEK